MAKKFVVTEDMFKEVSKEHAEMIAKHWGEAKTKWNQGNGFKLNPTHLIEVQKGIHKYFPEFDHYLDKHAKKVV